MEKKGYSLLQVIIIIVISSVISGITTGVIISKNNVGKSDLSYSEVLDDKYLQKFIESYSKLSSEYYVDVNKSDLIENAISGMTNYLNEAYTSFLNQDEANILYEKLNSTYNGLGVVLKENTIIFIVESSPADKVGMKIGDKITNINNIDVSNISSNEIINYIYNDNIENNITVLRENKTLSFKAKSENLKTPDVIYYMLDNNIGYLDINVFSGSCFEQTKKAIDYFNNKNIKGLIIDLRDNSGGYISQAHKIASLFTKKKDIIYYVKNQTNEEKVIDNDNIFFNKKTIVLINNQTASSAEVMTASLKDNNYASVVGTKSYGKGKIQHAYNLNDGSILKYTSSYWLTPNKNNIDGKGIIPNYEIENEYIYSDNKEEIIDIKDKQLEKAIELLM